MAGPEEFSQPSTLCYELNEACQQLNELSTSHELNESYKYHELYRHIHT